MIAPPELRLCNEAGLTIRVNPLGATWTSCILPLPDGERRELLLGSRDLGAMLAGGSYLGATVGRYAGRIAQGRFGPHQLDRNQPPHCLHGGSQGFSRRLWTLVSADAGAADAGQTQEPIRDRTRGGIGNGADGRIEGGVDGDIDERPNGGIRREIRLRLTSPDGDQGFPGTLQAEVSFLLANDNSVTIRFSATTDAPTPCNLTSHTYFNLNGGNRDDGLSQSLKLAATHYQPVMADGLPDGPPRPVASTGFDFQRLKRLDQDFLQDEAQQRVGGYDHSFLLDAPGMLQPAAELRASDGQVNLLIFSDQPALHLYTGQYLGGTAKRDGSPYLPLAGIALESQYPPDSPSRGEAILLPGQTYHHQIRYQFRTP
ncbi:MAG: hypothetical protein Q4D91_04765 [Lautropia sp.]|nr:hypothetical protein [Lautropia sp.]